MGGHSREKGFCHSPYPVFLLFPRSRVSGRLGGCGWAFPRLMSEFSHTYLSGVGGLPEIVVFRLEFVSQIVLSGVFQCLHWNLSQDWVSFWFFVWGVVFMGL